MRLPRRAVALCAPLAALVAAAVLAGCGSGGGSDATATVWITRDDGRTLLAEQQVPTGLNAIQAVDRSGLKLKTRYGGRYIQAIDGVSGSLARQQDWFLYVNGYEADRGGVEIELREGDVAWWDFHDWSGREWALVAGAYPEPFLHGYGGTRREVAVLYAAPGLKAAAEAVAQQVGGATVQAAGAGPAPAAGVSVVRLEAGGTNRAVLSFRGAKGVPGVPGDPVELVVGGALVLQLAADPAAFRRAYAVGAAAEAAGG